MGSSTPLILGGIALLIFCVCLGVAIWYFTSKSDSPAPDSGSSGSGSPATGSSPAPAPAPPSSKFTKVAGTDFVGNDISGSEMTSKDTVDLCATQCLNLPNCAGFIYNSTYKLCWSKTAMGNPVSRPDMDSYILDVTGYTTMPKYDYPNNDISCTNKTSVADCASGCTGANCLGFNYISRVGTNCCTKSALVAGAAVDNITFYKKI